jgi:hypothetical protein
MQRIHGLPKRYWYGLALVVLVAALLPMVGSKAQTTEDTIPATLIVSAEQSVLIAGNGQTTITALVRNRQGAPLPGVSVSFSSNGGGLSTTAALTNRAGVASTQFTAGPFAGIGQISANLGSLSDQIIVQMSEPLGNEEDYQLLLRSSAEALLPGGTTTLQATLLNSVGQPVAGWPLTLLASQGEVLPTSVLTNEQGQVEATFRAGNDSGTAVISVLGGYASQQMVVRIEPTIAPARLGSNLWIDPPTVRVGRPVEIGLIVQRRDHGTATLPPLAVQLYAGDLAQNNALDEVIVPPLSQRGTASTTPYRWTPTAAGTITLYALIDPGGALPGLSNTVISRTIVVQPATTIDQTAPVIQHFQLMEGSDLLTVPEMHLQINASDSDSDHTGMVFCIAQHVYNPQTMQWELLTVSPWQVFDPAQPWVSWQFNAMVGAGALQLWLQDGAGNTTITPAILRYTYSPLGVAYSQPATAPDWRWIALPDPMAPSHLTTAQNAAYLPLVWR